jgi:4'-phosphopantetheinyl transferase
VERHETADELVYVVQRVSLASRCEVRWLRIDAVPDGALDLLDAAERSRYDRFLRADDKRRFLAGRFLLRSTASSLLGIGTREVPLDATCPRCGEPHGKPRLPGGEVDLSISHAGGLAVLAYTTTGPVGVDVEPETAAPRLPELSRRVLTSAEQAEVAAIPEAERPRALLRYWTRKEAILKATGEGLGGDMTTIAISRPDESPSVVQARTHRPVHLHDLALPPGYVGSVAVLGPRVVVDVAEAAARL